MLIGEKRLKTGLHGLEISHFRASSLAPQVTKVERGPKVAILVLKDMQELFVLFSEPLVQIADHGFLQNPILDI